MKKTKSKKRGRKVGSKNRTPAEIALDKATKIPTNMGSLHSEIHEITKKKNPSK